MSQQQEMATDRLVSIIQRIQLERRTGLLTAWRGRGNTQEEGTIAFEKGKVTQSTAGRRRGSEALNWLTTWGTCRYIFVPLNASDTITPFLPAPSSGTGNRTTDTNPYLSRSMPDNAAASRRTEPLPGGKNTNAGTQKPPDTPSSSYPIPYRTRQLDAALQMIENMGLSRTHRHLLLLIDGQRTIQDLIRLMGRSELEFYGLLNDLEYATVIQIPRISPPR